VCTNSWPLWTERPAVGYSSDEPGNLRVAVAHGVVVGCVCVENGPGEQEPRDGDPDARSSIAGRTHHGSTLDGGS
jgi:hypothetical protein